MSPSAVDFSSAFRGQRRAADGAVPEPQGERAAAPGRAAALGRAAAPGPAFRGCRYPTRTEAFVCNQPRNLPSGEVCSLLPYCVLSPFPAGKTE